MQDFRGYHNEQCIKDLKSLYVKILKHKYRVFRFVDLGNNVYEIDLETINPGTTIKCVGYFVSPAQEIKNG